MKQEFKNAVEDCAQKAADEANNVDLPGDPATHITAYVDGRTKFVQDMKKHADKTGTKKYELGPVTVKNGHDGYTLRISGLRGTNIQNHNKKRRLYQKFEQYMSERGWNMNLSLDVYAR